MTSSRAIAERDAAAIDLGLARNRVDVLEDQARTYRRIVESYETQRRAMQAELEVLRARLTELEARDTKGTDVAVDASEEKRAV